MKLALIAHLVKPWLLDEVDKAVSADETVGEFCERIKRRILDNEPFWHSLCSQSESWIEAAIRRITEPRDDATRERDHAFYLAMREKFLREYLYPANPTIPHLEKQTVFPWDTFCEANPELRNVAERFEAENHYELSENQASWAVMMYRWEKLHSESMPIRADDTFNPAESTPEKKEEKL